MKWLSQKLEQRTKPNAWSEVTLILTNDPDISRINAEYFNKNRPTDVISFRYDPIPGEPNNWSGDIIVNVERAIQAGSLHDGINHELALYIAHGFDHLAGAEDDTPEKRAKMHDTEHTWIQQATHEKILNPLFQ